MNKIFLFFAGLVILAISSGYVNAQNTATVNNAVANATIVTPITLSNNLTFEFGKLVKPLSGTGTVTISAEATPTRTFGSDLINIPNDIWRPAQFTVTGDDSYRFSITKPETITLNGSETAAGGTLSVTTSISGNTTNVSTSSGSYVFYIGGSMNVPSTQLAGPYSGTYTVTVQYE